MSAQVTLGHPMLGDGTKRDGSQVLCNVDTWPWAAQQTRWVFLTYQRGLILVLSPNTSKTVLVKYLSWCSPYLKLVTRPIRKHLLIVSPRFSAIINQDDVCFTSAIKDLRQVLCPQDSLHVRECSSLVSLAFPWAVKQKPCLQEAITKG